MDNFLYFYQHFPLYLNPDLKIGLLSISWYSIMYLVGFGVVYYLLRYRIKKREAELPNSKFQNAKQKTPDTSLLVDFLMYSFVGLLIGARLGEVILYNFSYYWQNPLAIISPFDPTTHEFIGIYGMSYHGGLIGVLMATLIFVKKYRVNFRSLSDFVVPAIPAGYFFGRIGNFINNELYGRVTTKPWGMYFRDDLLNLRHPSQLYEAFLEGIVLFIILWNIRNKEVSRGYLLPVYLIGYAFFRFICEFFREPDDKSGYFLNLMAMGQWLSVFMAIFGLVFFFKKEEKRYN
jgi:phosphatidylglycerol---prolipoprotein diacylglyceryl transferase